MSSGLGKGRSVGIRSEFEELAAAVFTSGNTSNGSVAAASMATSVRLIKLSNMAKVFYLDNSTNQPISLAVITPEDDTRTRVKWLTIASGRIINLELASNNLSIEAGVEVWAWAPGTAPASGFLSMYTWG
jgi:hypothetical protein